MLPKRLMVGVIILLIGLTGCSRYYRSELQDDNLITVSREMTEHLLGNLKQPLPRGSLVAVNTFVNVGEPSQHAPLGQILSEQMLSALHRQGYRIIAMELPGSAFEKNQAGVLNLAETTKDALKAAGAQALLVGFLAPGKNHTYVSARLIEVMGQNVISTEETVLTMGSDTKALLSHPGQ